MHYPRIPHKYWRHRIQMAKALGLNTISSYIFWNFHQLSANDHLDFSSEAKNLRHFISLIHEEGMYMLLRPGPYVCGEWDGGGLPHWLLNEPMQIRCSDELYLARVEKYVEAVAREIRDLQITRGGPILMVQIENEYGSYGNDHRYLKTLETYWRKHGIDVPFYTADGAWVVEWKDAIQAGSVPDGVLGIDPGVEDESWNQAKTFAEIRKIPVFSSETYPGWMTHWDEGWKGKDTSQVLLEIEYLLKNGKSFNLYMIHGGTNFGFSAGANYDETNGFQPQITSYDYDAPINEQGAATEKYKAIKQLIEQYKPANANLGLEIPKQIPTITINSTTMKLHASLWENIPNRFHIAMPKPMESFNQFQGLIIYRNNLTGPTSGNLKIRDVHDLGLIYLDDKLVDTIDRMQDPKKIINMTESKTLEILIMAMGRVNFGEEMLDHKGITDYVSLGGLKLMDWDVFPLDFEDNYLRNLNELIPGSKNRQKQGLFFKATINLEEIGDTYIDVSKFKMGAIWVNGYNLGRYWTDKGPQTSLYCPGSYLKYGMNEVLILDLFQTEESEIKGLFCLS